MPIHIYDRVGSVFLMITLWAIPGWWRRVVLVLLLWAADRPVNVQRVLGLAGEITAPIRPWVAQDGTPVLSGILLFVLCWWYWRDVLQAKIRATGTSEQPRSRLPERRFGPAFERPPKVVSPQWWGHSAGIARSGRVTRGADARSPVVMRSKSLQSSR
jgi:hypothetical protein